jgi:pyrroloquinoline-quinone synthase
LERLWPHQHADEQPKSDISQTVYYIPNIDYNDLNVEQAGGVSITDPHGEQDMAVLMNREEFRTALEESIKGKSANKAPFSVAWASGKLSRAHLARWAENHYHYVGPFADYLAYIYARTPDHMTEAKDFLLANMYEEEIGGDRHTDLLIRFAEACGTTRERVVNPDNMSPTTRGLQAWCYSVAMREDPVVAVAALVVGLESQVPSIYRKQTPTLRETYQFTDEEVEFFDLHIVSDEIHGERGYQIVLEQANTPELQQRCLKICEVGAQMRLLYTTALFHDYVAQEIPLHTLQLAA